VSDVATIYESKYIPGKWVCLACGAVWDGHQLYRDEWRAGVLTCGNLMCGGTCVRVKESAK